MTARYPNSKFDNDLRSTTITSSNITRIPNVNITLTPVHPSGSLVYDTQSENIQYSNGNMWMNIGGGGGGFSSILTWRPGYIGSEPGVYGKFEELYTDLILSTTPRIINFDPSLSKDTIPFIFPVGKYDMSYVTWYASNAYLVTFGGFLAGGLFVQIPDGCYFTNLCEINGPLIITYEGTSSPCIEIQSTDGFTTSNRIRSSVKISNGVGINCAGTQPFYSFYTDPNAAFGIASVFLENLVIIQLSISPVLYTGNLTKLIVYIGENVIFSNGTISGTGFAQLTLSSHVSITGIPTQIPFQSTNFPGIANVGILDITGSSKSVNSSGPPVAPYDSSGGFVRGDTYLDTSSGDMYIFTGIMWKLL